MDIERRQAFRLKARGIVWAELKDTTALSVHTIITSGRMDRAVYTIIDGPEPELYARLLRDLDGVRSTNVQSAAGASYALVHWDPDWVGN